MSTQSEPLGPLALRDMAADDAAWDALAEQAAACTCTPGYAGTHQSTCAYVRNLYAAPVTQSPFTRGALAATLPGKVVR